MKLYLDGIKFFCQTVEYYGYGSSKDVSDLKKHVWSRLTILVQSVLLIIECVVMQLLRAVASLASGILTLEGRKIVSAFIDVVSVPVQVVTLAILGLVGTFVPRVAKRWGEELLNHSRSITDHNPDTCNKLRLEITGIIRGILALPIGVTDGVTLGVSGVLAGDKDRVLRAIFHFTDGIISPIQGLVTAISSEARKRVWAQHWIEA